MSVFLALLLLAELDPEAVKAYEEARRKWETRSEEGLRGGLALFEKAADIEPRFAEAHAGVADAACLLALYGFAPPGDVLPRAKEAASRAIELDPKLATAHASLGLVRYLYDWSFAEAEASFRRSIELDPRYAAVHHWYGMMLMATGRFEEALVQIEFAAALEPDSPLYPTKRGAILLASGRLDQAERQLEEVVRRFPGFTMAHRELAELALERGRLEAARHYLEEGAREEPLYGYVLGRLGRREEAERILARFDEGGVSPLDAALVLAGLGEKDRALGELERALAARDPALVYIDVQPGFRELRSEPRFRAILDRLGL